MQPIHIVNAFCLPEQRYSGNPAAVVPLQAWLDDATLQAIAQQNQLSETAYTVPIRDGFELRWFTPAAEVPLCGHATLAAAHVLFNTGQTGSVIRFKTQRGWLQAIRNDDQITITLPVVNTEPCAADIAIKQAFGEVTVLRGNYLYIVTEAQQVIHFKLDRSWVSRICQQYNVPAVALTADAVSGTTVEADVMLRVFAPLIDIDEDPVTGSALAALIPYWSQQLNQSQLTAWQASARGGLAKCKHQADTQSVTLQGHVMDYLQGHLV